MARKPRIHCPDSFYYANLRANADTPLFRCKEDGNYFYQLLEACASKYQCQIHGFCLTTDSIDLIIKINEKPLSSIMHNLGYRFTKYLQHAYKLSGSVFHDRYRAQLFDDSIYLAPYLNYLHALPISKHLATSSEQYIWSSARAYGNKENFDWLTTADGMAQITNQPFRARMTEKMLKRSILGDAKFQQHALQQNNHKQQIIDFPNLVQAVCNQCEISPENLIAPGKNHHRSKARGVLALLARDLPSISLTDASRFVARDLTTLSALAHRIEKKSKQDQALAATIARIKSTVLNTTV